MGSKTANRTEALVTAFQANNSVDLKRLANDSIREAAVENDKELAELAVIAYTLYKILSKDHLLEATTGQQYMRVLFKN